MPKLRIINLTSRVIPVIRVACAVSVLEFLLLLSWATLASITIKRYFLNKFDIKRVDFG